MGLFHPAGVACSPGSLNLVARGHSHGDDVLGGSRGAEPLGGVGGGLGGGAGWGPVDCVLPGLGASGNCCENGCL